MGSLKVSMLLCLIAALRKKGRAAYRGTASGAQMWVINQKI